MLRYSSNGNKVSVRNNPDETLFCGSAKGSGNLFAVGVFLPVTLGILRPSLRTWFQEHCILDNRL